MPLYDYRCRSCDNELEVQQSINDDALTTCPECGGQLRKVFSPVGISFKGSGFYRNDARSSSNGGSKRSGEGTGSGSGSESSSGGDSGTSSDNKAAAGSTSGGSGTSSGSSGGAGTSSSSGGSSGE
jgi:putative FmdB family regulatory protein